MSPKHSSLALDEYSKELDQDQHFEPELKVIVNAHYATAPFALPSSDLTDVVHIKGRITVSF